MREHAILPQNDPDQAQRAEQLAQSRQAYEVAWDIVPGVAMAASVPDEAKPSKTWTLATLPPLKRIFANVIANRLAEEEEIIEGHVSQIVGQNATFGQKFRGFLTGAVDAVEFAGHVDVEVSKQLMQHVLTGRHISQHEEPTASSPWESPLTPHGRPESVGCYDELYRELIRPPVMETWNDDDWFAQMRVSGQNPMLIKGVDELPGNFPVSEDIYAKTAAPGDTLAAALSEGRLFLLDYHLIAEVVEDNQEPIHGERKYTPAPIALFGVGPDDGTLKAVAIQAGQDPAKFSITTPQDGWAWRNAKTAVQVADANYHEMVCHLGQAHLIMEAAALATMHQFSDRHPLYRLLAPHFEGTVAINNSAAHSMLAPGGVIDLSFGGTLESMIALTQRTVAEYDFQAAMPPADFERRKVGPESRLTDYAYRDDALRIWDAISAWAQSYVDHYYDDQSIAGDPELAAWSEALSQPPDKGGIGGFVPITNMESLSRALAMIMFTASAQHAAVNFTQWADMSYSPGLGGALWTEWKDGEATEQDWLDLLPPLQFGELQAEFLTLLGGVHHTRLGEYKSNRFPYRTMITDKEIIEGPLAVFHARLTEIETKITRDNRELKRRSAPYDYLLPSRIPASINI